MASASGFLAEALECGMVGVSDLSDLQPGDVFIGNDAYTCGGTHLNDFVLMEPVFDNETLVAWVANLAHHSDFVDRSHAHIYQEGLRIPPIRLYRAGALQEDVQHLILLNCQVPRGRINDLRAQMAANRLGVRRYQDPCDKYGPETVAKAAHEALESTERRTRAGIALIPDGSYSFGHPFDTNLIDEILDLKVTVDVRGEEIFFDFPDAPPQMRAPINMVRTALLATVYFAGAKHSLTPISPSMAGSIAPSTWRHRRTAFSMLRRRRRSTAERILRAGWSI